MAVRLLITFLLFAVVSGASGTISMSNAYFTEGATVQESLQYHNMNFDNSVYIGQDIISSTGNAEPAGNGTRSYSDRVKIATNSGTTIGGYVDAKGDLGSVSRGVVGGHSNNFIGLNYALGSGDVESGSYNAYTQAGARTHAENNAQSFGSVVSSEGSIGIYGGGAGSSYGKAPNISFEQDVWLSHMGKVAELDSGIRMIRKEGLKPVTYGWSMGVTSDSSRMATTEDQIQIAAGDSDTNASILGTSSELSKKETKVRLIPLDINETKDSKTGNPWSDPDIENMIDLLKRSLVEKKLFMSYEITP